MDSNADRKLVELRYGQSPNLERPYTWKVDGRFMWRCLSMRHKLPQGAYGYLSTALAADAAREHLEHDADHRSVAASRCSVGRVMHSGATWYCNRPDGHDGPHHDGVEEFGDDTEDSPQ